MGGDAGRDGYAETIAAIRPHVERTYDDGVLESLSGYGAFYALPDKQAKGSLVVTAVAAAGAKLEIAHAVGSYGTVGRDLVAAVADTIVSSGARPVLIHDYLAAGGLDVARTEEVVRGVADACEEVGCALGGGETVVPHPLLGDGRVDLAGFGFGLVGRDDALDADRVEPGDAIVAMASTGLHLEGFEVARRVLADSALDLAHDHGLRVQSLGEALLRPSAIYAPHCLALAEATAVRALGRVGRGGVEATLRRILPDGVGAVVDTQTFTPPGVFDVLSAHGRLAPQDMWRTFNMGAGMLAVVVDGQQAVGLLGRRGVDAWVCGAVRADGGVRIAGLS